MNFIHVSITLTTNLSSPPTVHANSYLFRGNINSVYEYYNVPLTTFHILFYCTFLQWERQMERVSYTLTKVFKVVLQAITTFLLKFLRAYAVYSLIFLSCLQTQLLYTVRYTQRVSK